MPNFLKTELNWLDDIQERIDRVFINQLTHEGRFCELYTDKDGNTRPVGIWGWNTWCGIHDLTPLVGSDVHDIVRDTLDEGLSRPEPGTGLLPHSVPIDSDGRIGYREGRENVYYRTYSGVHGEDYCLDNIICWAKMALEFFLYTRDRSWLSQDKLQTIEKSTDYILDNLRGEYNPNLIESGIEGDWTENTDWHADNSNNNVCMIQCLRQLAEVESIFGRTGKEKRYRQAEKEIKSAFLLPAEEGGFWDSGRGYFLHGNDARGQRVYGHDYFESTANYMALLLGIPSRNQSERIWHYLEANPEIESPLPVLTNHLPRKNARRENYGQSITNGDVWLTLGAHAAVARLRSGYVGQASGMYRAIMGFERREGTIHNSIFMDWTHDGKWSPEIGNYGSLITPLTEGVLGLQPIAGGLRIKPCRLTGMKNLDTTAPLSYAGKNFFLDIKWRGGTSLTVTVDGKKVPTPKGHYLLRPGYPDGCRVKMVFS